MRTEAPKSARLVVALLGFAAAIGISEIGVRAYVAWRARQGLIEGYVASDVAGISYLPGRSAMASGLPFSNNLGLINPRATSVQKAPDTFRILVVGDSVAQVVMDREGSRFHESLFTAQLEKELRVRTRREVEVLNLSAVGLSLAQELLLLRARGFMLQPDMVLFAYCYNDPVETEVGRGITWRGSPTFPAMLWLYDRLQDLEQLRREGDWYASSGPIYRHLEATFAELGALAQRKRIALVGLPLLWNEPQRQIHLPTLEAMTKRHGIPYLNLWERLSRMDLERNASRQIPHDHIHYTPNAHRLVAEEISAILAPVVAEGTWPPPTSER